MEENDDAEVEPRYWEKKLWLACESGDVSTAQEAIRNSANVNWENPEDKYYTPLHRATMFCNKEVVELLLSNGANPNSVNENKRTPLTTAAKVGNKKIVKLLLDNGASIETTGGDMQFTALHLAAKYSNVSVVELLVKRGARVDPEMMDGNTPLHVASREGHIKVIQCLDQHQANLYAVNRAGKTPLDLSVEANQPATADYLRKAIENRGARGTILKERLLWEACRAGDAVKARELLMSELGAVNFDWANPTFHMYTPLNIATMYGHEQIVKLLFDTGADPSKASENGDIPLVTAARAGYEEIVRYLLDTCHVDIDSTDSYGNTALHKAAKHAHMSVVKLLVTKRANMNLRNKEDNTPLHLSSKEGHPMVLRYLLEHDANPKLRNKDEKTALELALEQNNSISVGLLSEGSKEAVLWNACKGGDLAKVKEMMLRGAKVRWRNPACNDYTPLHIAGIYGHAEIVEELLKNGDANPNDSNRNGFSPLITAANNGDLLIFKHLLKWNASVDFQGIHKDTAIHRAAKHSYREMVEILIGKNARLDLLNKDGNTPLHMAAMEGHAVIVRYLVQKGANVSITNNSRNTAEDLARKADHQCVLFELKAAPLQTSAKHDSATDIPTESDYISGKLFKYAAKGDLDAVKKALHQNADPNWQNKKHNNDTALHIAILYGHTKIVEELLENRFINTHSTNAANETVLHVAVKEGAEEMVKILLQKQTAMPLNARNSKHNTALHLAVKYSHQAITILLVEAGADLNPINRDGNTPLHLASKRGHLVLVKFLEEKGALCDIPNKLGYTAQDLLNKQRIGQNDDEIPSPSHGNLVDDVFDEDTDLSKQQRLWNACHTNNVTAVKQLLTNGVNPIWSNPDLMNYSCLHVAVMYGHTKVVEVLLKTNMNCDLTGNDQEFTPLHVAALKGRNKIAKKLLESGADKNKKDHKGQTPLHLAVTNDFWRVVDLLCDKWKVNLNEKNEDGNTALHLAASSGNAVLVEKLVNCGAQKDITNKDVKTPQALAEEHCHSFIAKLLVKPQEYRMDSTPRGHCIIINNYNFTDGRFRFGSEKDVEKLEWLFGELLGFKVEKKMDLTAETMRDAMEKAKRYQHHCCLVVAVMSHGTCEGIIGVDGQIVTVRELMAYFTSTACQSLAGKPKIFIIQACRNVEEKGHSAVNADGPIGQSVQVKNTSAHALESVSNIPNTPEMADMAIAFATVDNQPAYRSMEGSWFIQAFVQTVSEFAATNSYQEIASIVNDRLSSKYGSQLSMQSGTLRKLLYFHPIEIPAITAKEESHAPQKRPSDQGEEMVVS